jgi:hypothetical protein
MSRAMLLPSCRDQVSVLLCPLWHGYCLHKGSWTSVTGHCIRRMTGDANVEVCTLLLVQKQGQSHIANPKAKNSAKVSSSRSQSAQGKVEMRF